MHRHPLTITIDGPAGVGKTTLARHLARSLDIAYLDTGAMFRAVGWLYKKHAWDKQEFGLEFLAGLNFGLEGTGSESCVTLNGRTLGPEIRTEEVGMWASEVGGLELVRTFLKKAQQKMGDKISLVAEGRDMGSVVFPNAPYKFFLDARPEVRAQRRLAQLAGMGIKADHETILFQIIKRDEQDRNRTIAPLKPAPDAMVIDTGSLNTAQVFKKMMEILPAPH